MSKVPAAPASREGGEPAWIRFGWLGLLTLLVWGGSVLTAPRAEAQDAALDFGGTVIEGQVFAPEITVFIARENLAKNYNIKLEESFLFKIVESVGRAPF